MMPMRFWMPISLQPSFRDNPASPPAQAAGLALKRVLSYRLPEADTAPLPATLASRGAPALGAPPLRSMVEAEIAIIGGGFTGLSTALHAREAGRSVALLEGREIGWGGSGRAFGQVVPYTRHSEAALLRILGPVWGPRLMQGAAEAPDLVFNLIDRHGIDCDAVRSGLIFAAHGRRAVPGLEARCRFWQTRGADVDMLHGDKLRRLTGSDFYDTALLDRRGGSVNPLALARGLAAAVREAGGAVFEGSRATRLMPLPGGGWQVDTAEGVLRAGQVVLATDAYTDDLRAGLRRVLMPLRAYQLVSAPLSDPWRGRILPDGQALTDTRRLYSGLRLRPDGRLQVSVGGPILDARGVPSLAGAKRRMRDLFPGLGPLRWEEAVAGWVGMSRDQVPHIYPLAPNLHAATGLSGRGIALGVSLGRDVVMRLLGSPEEDWMVPDTDPAQLPPAPFLRLLMPGLVAANGIMDRLQI
jgi:glycine/D-amino acid oxidase-like deaminating enzyme